jgi:hypothetical protein
MRRVMISRGRFSDDPLPLPGDAHVSTADLRNALYAFYLTSPGAKPDGTTSHSAVPIGRNRSRKT